MKGAKNKVSRAETSSSTTDGSATRTVSLSQIDYKRRTIEWLSIVQRSLGASVRSIRYTRDGERKEYDGTNEPKGVETKPDVREGQHFRPNERSVGRG